MIISFLLSDNNFGSDADFVVEFPRGSGGHVDASMGSVVFVNASAAVGLVARDDAALHNPLAILVQHQGLV